MRQLYARLLEANNDDILNTICSNQVRQPLQWKWQHPAETTWDAAAQPELDTDHCPAGRVALPHPTGRPQPTAPLGRRTTCTPRGALGDQRASQEDTTHHGDPDEQPAC